MKVKIKVPNEAAGQAVFNALKKYGATDQDGYIEVLEGKNLKNCFIQVDSLISTQALKKYLPTLNMGAVLK